MFDNLRACIGDFYDSLNPSGFPGGTRQKLYYSRVPITDETGAQITALRGYVCFTLQSVGEEQLFESDIETYRLTFTAFMTNKNVAAPTDTIIQAVRFNSQSPESAAGFDNRATLPGLSGMELLGIFPEGPPETVQSPHGDKDSNNVFQTTMKYKVQVERAY